MNTFAQRVMSSQDDSKRWSMFVTAVALGKPQAFDTFGNWYRTYPTVPKLGKDTKRFQKLVLLPTVVTPFAKFLTKYYDDSAYNQKLASIVVSISANSWNFASGILVKVPPSYIRYISADPFKVIQDRAKVNEFIRDLKALSVSIEKDLTRLGSKLNVRFPGIFALLTNLGVKSSVLDELSAHPDYKDLDRQLLVLDDAVLQKMATELDKEKNGVPNKLAELCKANKVKVHTVKWLLSYI